MSMWDAPPLRKNRIVDFAFPPFGTLSRSLAAALPGRPKLIPANEQLDATKNVRRDVDEDMLVNIVATLSASITRCVNNRSETKQTGAKVG